MVNSRKWQQMMWQRHATVTGNMGAKKRPQAYFCFRLSVIVVAIAWEQLLPARGDRKTQSCRQNFDDRLSITLSVLRGILASGCRSSSKSLIFWWRRLWALSLGLFSQLCRWNLDPVCRSSRDINISGFGGHIAVSGCWSLSQSPKDTVFEFVIGCLSIVVREVLAFPVPVVILRLSASTAFLWGRLPIRTPEVVRHDVKGCGCHCNYHSRRLTLEPPGNIIQNERKISSVSNSSCAFDVMFTTSGARIDYRYLIAAFCARSV